MKKFSKIFVGTVIFLIITIYGIYAYPTFAKSTSLNINEICAKNTTFQAPDGNYYDWIEFYNDSFDDIDISGWGLSDETNNPFKYVFPENTVIHSKEYFIVYCDKKASKLNNAIANFGLSSDGDTLMLSDTFGGVSEDITYPELDSDISYGYIEELDIFCCFDLMSPFSVNSLDNVMMKTPEFSMKSGFYDDDFSLFVNYDTIDGYTKIYYTLDGSIPNSESLLYNDMTGIHISDATIYDNRLSAYSNISVGKNYYAPSTRIDKSTVVRAIAINEAGKQSKVITGTYFVGSSYKEKYSDEVILSIVTDEDNLFSDANGIYVTGDTYSEWLNGSDYNGSIDPSRQPANYNNKGREWERPATIQIISEDKELLSEDVGIRIHGGATRADFQKSFSVYAREAYGNSKIQYDFFNGENVDVFGDLVLKYDSILLRNAGNDYFSLRFRDKVNQALIKERNLSTQKMTPAIVFINGELWGHYEITEKISDYYIESHYGIEKENVCIVKNNELEEGSQEAFDQWNDLYEWIINNDFSDSGNYELVKQYIDLGSFIDYISINAFIANTDWGNGNTAWWKSEIIDSSNAFADGKWRLIVFDSDVSDYLYTTNNYSMDFFSWMDNQNRVVINIFNKLKANVDFREEFCRAFLDICNDIFDSQKVIEMIETLSPKYKNYTMEYYKRFLSHNSFTSEDYDLNINTIKSFFLRRIDYIVPYMKSNMNLTGNLVTVKVCNDDTLGNVELNTLKLLMNNEGVWTGRYYTDFEIHLNTVPQAGKAFLYYEVTDGSGLDVRIYDTDTSIPISTDTVIAIVYSDAESTTISGVPYIDTARQEYDPTVPHIIIDSVYGGKKKESYASHSFIELYNQTDEDVDLTGWSLQYRSSIDGGDNVAWSKLDLSGTIPSHCSYLVRCASIKNPVEGSIDIDNYDQDWNQVINNKGCSVVLVANNKQIPADSAVFDNETGKPVIYDYVDMVGVSGNDTDTEEDIANEAAMFYEKAASQIQSKKTGIRREKLKDTDDNTEDGDFIAVDYSFGNADYIAYISPKCVADGAWEYNKNNVPRYTVTFVEHDDVTSQKKFKYNTKADKPDDPERDGYTFTGWFEDAECTSSFSFKKTKPVSDITLYAGWTPIDYSISYYNVDEADNSNPISYTIEDEDIILADPVKEGHVFCGWYSDAEFTGEAITSIAVTDIEDVKLYARWKEIITPGLTIEGWKYGDSASNPVVSGPVSGAAIRFEYKVKGSDDSTYSEDAPVLAGDYTVKAALSETEEFVFNKVTTDFTVARALVTVKANDSSKIYGSLDPEFTADVVGLKYNDTASDIVYALYRTSGESAGTYSMLPAGSAVQGNYDVVYAEGTFTINAKTVSDPAIVLSSDTFVYDGTKKTPGVTMMDGSTVIDPNEYEVVFSDNTAAGTATVTVTDKDGGNYIVSGSREFTISKAVPTILVVPEAGPLTFGQSLADSAVTGGAVSVAGTFVWDNADIIPSVANSDVTEYSVVFTPADTYNYDAVKFGVKVSVAKAEPQYTVPTGITAVYGDALADVVLPDGWAWADGSVSVGDVGVHSFAAIFTPVDTLNYYNVTDMVEVTVAKVAPVLTVPTAKINLTYNGTSQELVNYSVVSGGAIKFAIVNNDGDSNGVPEDSQFSTNVPMAVSAGSYTVWYKVTGDENHEDTAPASINVEIGRASAVVYADNTGKVYGETDPALGATVSGLKGSDSEDVLTFNMIRSAGESVGTYNIVPVGEAVQGNYIVSYVSGAFTVEAKTVADSGIVLSQDSYVYDGTAKRPSATVMDGNIVIDPTEYTVSYSDNTNPGTATVIITDKEGGNYKVNGSISFVIGKADVDVTAPVVNKNLVYNGLAQELVTVGAIDGGTVYFALVDGNSYAVPAESEFGTAIPSATSAGDYTVWYKVAGDENHLSTEPVALYVTIGRASATVTVNNCKKAYGETDPTLSATVTGLLGSDGEGLINYDIMRAAGEDIGSYTVRAFGEAVQGNYNVAYVPGTFTVTAKDVQDCLIVLSENEFTYDGTAKTPSVSVRIGNVLIPETEYTVSFLDNVNAGTATVTVSDVVGGNYTVNGSVSFVIVEEQENGGETGTGESGTEENGTDESGTGESGNEGTEAGESGTSDGNNTGSGDVIDSGSGSENGLNTDNESTSGNGSSENNSDNGSGNIPNTGSNVPTSNVTGTGESNGAAESDGAVDGDASNDSNGESDKTNVTDIDYKSNTNDIDDGEVAKTPSKAYSNRVSINSKFKVSQNSLTIKVKWGQVDDADGYEVYVAYRGDSYGKPVKVISGNDTLSATIKEIDGKPVDTTKNFKLYVVSYKLVGDVRVPGTKSIVAYVTGKSSEKYSNVKKVLVEKSKITLAVGKLLKIKASVELVDSEKIQRNDKSVAEFRYISSNKSVATVTKNGKIKAKAKGTCYIYVFARNGKMKKVKVTVK